MSAPEHLHQPIELLELILIVAFEYPLLIPSLIGLHYSGCPLVEQSAVSVDHFIELSLGDQSFFENQEGKFIAVELYF